MALRGRWRAHAQLLTILKGINGNLGGYWHNVEDRVFPVLVRPEDGFDHGGYPYICAPLLLTQPAPLANRSTSDTYDLWTWKQPIYYFCRDQVDTLEDNDIAEQVMKLGEDVIRAIALDWTLGETADDSRFTEGGNEMAGAAPDEDYGEGELLLSIDQRFAPEDLGPNATA